jgi:hypothetical protein
MNEKQHRAATAACRELGPSSRLPHLLKQAQRCFRLARTLGNHADAERFNQLGQSFLDQARRAAEEQGDTDE